MPGPGTWADAGGLPLLSAGLWIRWPGGDAAGRFFEGGARFPVPQWSRELGPVRLTTMAGTGISQSVWIGGDAPLNLAPLSFRLQASITEELDFWTLRESSEYGRPFELWMDVPLTDLWHVPSGPAAAGGLQAWQTSRSLPWDIAGISHATRPPKVYLDEAEQTVVTSGTPGVGEVLVPESGGAGTVTTPDLSASGATLLKMRYHPKLSVAAEVLGESYGAFNSLVFDLQITELIGRQYTAAGVVP